MRGPILSCLGGASFFALAEVDAFPFLEAGAMAIIVGVLLNQAFAHQKRIEEASAKREEQLSARLAESQKAHREELAEIAKENVLALERINETLESFKLSHPCTLRAVSPAKLRNPPPPKDPSAKTTGLS